jgi:5'-3' exonuclease
MYAIQYTHIHCRTPKLLRKMTFSQAAKQPIMEVDYAKVLSGLGLTHEEFVDLCILCGCDYTDRSVVVVAVVI